MITDFFSPKWNQHEVQELWFQQVVSTCHQLGPELIYRRKRYCILSRSMNWRPCDFTPLEYVKSQVNKAENIDHLQENIRNVIGNIRQQMQENLIKNCTYKLVTASRNSNITEIIFKVLCQNLSIKVNFISKSHLRYLKTLCFNEISDFLSNKCCFRILCFPKKRKIMLT